MTRDVSTLVQLHKLGEGGSEVILREPDPRQLHEIFNSEHPYVKKRNDTSFLTCFHKSDSFWIYHLPKVENPTYMRETKQKVVDIEQNGAWNVVKQMKYSGHRVKLEDIFKFGRVKLRVA